MEPVALTNDQVIGIIQTQQSQVKTLTAMVDNLNREKAKLEQMVEYIATVNGSTAPPSLNSGMGSVAEVDKGTRALSACLCDLHDRDETIKKLKGLYLKSLIDSNELRTQITDLRNQLQEIQSVRYSEQMNRK